MQMRTQCIYLHLSITPALYAVRFWSVSATSSAMPPPFLRDVKPANFCLSLDEDHPRVHMIDLGMLIRADDATTVLWCGTPVYASRRALSTRTKGVHFSDDLEATLFCLLFLHIGKLPWPALVRRGRHH